MQESIGSLVIDVAGHSLTQEDKALLAHPMVGGVILFAHNYQTPTQLKELCVEIRRSRQKPVLIMVDQEGGRVQRFIDGFTRLPFMGDIGEWFDHSPNDACQLAEECGWLMAVELLACSIDISLAPVLDLNPGISSVIGKRSFHASSDTVVTLARAFISGMRQAGMVATGKHFPGHGSVVLDSHLDHPHDTRPLNEVMSTDLQPFVRLIKEGIPALMAAHIVFDHVDPNPVVYSSKWLKTILRQQLGFQGVVISDDLNMEGANISSRYSDRVVAAKEAGCDLVLLCGNRPAVISVLDDLPSQSYQLDNAIWMPLKAKPSNVVDNYTNDERWQKTHAVLTKCNGQSPASWQKCLAELLS